MPRIFARDKLSDIDHADPTLILVAIQRKKDEVDTNMVHFGLRSAARLASLPMVSEQHSLL